MTFRGFIAIDIESSEKLLQIGEKIENTRARIKPVKPENMHITLKFLGDTEEEKIEDIEKIMKESVEDIDPFELSLEGMGVFPNQNFIKVIWAGSEPKDKSAKIANTIDEKLVSLGFKKEKRDFSPHLTIARVKSGKDKDKILEIINNNKQTFFSKQKVDSIKLKKSDLTPKGPVYSTLKKVKL
ncbi:MAG: RNA 2',3'-cyclic phosphodiesterase [Candidatus Thermoplasmatota archaeon]